MDTRWRHQRGRAIVQFERGQDLQATAVGVTIFALGRAPGQACQRPAWLHWRQALACYTHRCVGHHRTAFAADFLDRASDSNILRARQSATGKRGELPIQQQEERKMTTKTQMKLVLLGLAMLTAAPTALAQGSQPPGPPMEMAPLKGNEGSWVSHGNAPAGSEGPAHKSTTSVKIHGDPDGMWLTGRVEEAASKGNARPFKGVLHMTYDTTAKGFLMLWVDRPRSTAAALLPMVGSGVELKRVLLTPDVSSSTC
jgi:hypothetical protein